MKRRLLPVIAWIGATGLSIAVANAAVGSVRNQVSDAPNLSLATTTTTASVATAAPTSMVPTSISTSIPSTTLDLSAIAPTSSTAPAATVGATSATTATAPTTTATVSTTTTTAASTTGPTPPTTAAAAGEIQTYSVTGGTVSIEVFNDRIVLLGAVPASGWSVEEVEQSSDHIEIEFKSGELESKFKAELGSGGQLSIETE